MALLVNATSVAAQQPTLEDFARDLAALNQRVVSVSRPWLTWQGLFVGVENTSPWRTLFAQPGISASATALVGIRKVSLRVVYIHPLQYGGFGPAFQVGASVRVF